MNQFSFKPRVLILAMAFAAASIVNAQTTDGAPAAAATAPSADSSTSYAPCSGMQGAALSECLKASAAISGTTDAQASAGTGAPAVSTDGKTAPGDITSMDRTILAASGSAAHSTKATKSKPASTNQTHVASATPRTSSRTQSKNAVTANPADTAYRAELRSCVQMQGVERDSCLDRAIEHHATS
jgi:hypothetical protein